MGICESILMSVNFSFIFSLSFPNCFETIPQLRISTCCFYVSILLLTPKLIFLFNDQIFDFYNIQVMFQLQYPTPFQRYIYTYSEALWALLNLILQNSLFVEFWLFFQGVTFPQMFAQSWLFVHFLRISKFFCSVLTLSVLDRQDVLGIQVGAGSLSSPGGTSPTLRGHPWFLALFSSSRHSFLIQPVG